MTHEVPCPVRGLPRSEVGIWSGQEDRQMVSVDEAPVLLSNVLGRAGPRCLIAFQARGSE